MQSQYCMRIIGYFLMALTVNSLIAMCHVYSDVTLVHIGVT